MNDSPVALAVRQPKAAAVAGLAFGLILGAVLLLLQSVTRGSLSESGGWIGDEAQRGAVSTALALIPFAGIAFLWFIAVVRSSLGHQADRFFDTVFMGSGLVFVAMLFAAAAVLMAALALHDAGLDGDPESAARAWALASALLGSFGARMAAVFALTVSSAGLRMGTLPRPLVLLGLVTGGLLLLTPPLPSWAQLLFPLWVIALSILVLVRQRSEGRPQAPAPPQVP